MQLSGDAPGGGVGQAAASIAAEELTPRETQVLRQPRARSIDPRDCRALSVGDETIKTHVARVLAKLQVENRAQAIVQALKRGLVSLQERE